MSTALYFIHALIIMRNYLCSALNVEEEWEFIKSLESKLLRKKDCLIEGKEAKQCTCP